MAVTSYRKKIGHDSILAAKAMLVAVAASIAFSVAGTHAANAAPAHQDDPAGAQDGQDGLTPAPQGLEGPEGVPVSMPIQPESTITCNRYGCGLPSTVPAGTYWAPAQGSVTVNSPPTSTQTGVGILPYNCTVSYNTTDANSVVTGRVEHCV